MKHTVNAPGSLERLSRQGGRFVRGTSVLAHRRSTSAYGRSFAAGNDHASQDASPRARIPVERSAVRRSARDICRIDASTGPVKSIIRIR